MLLHSVSILDDPEGLVALPKEHKDLEVALRSAVATDWKLDKSSSLNNDLTDAFIMIHDMEILLARLTERLSKRVRNIIDKEEGKSS
jgi:hypothetical protein